MIQTLPPHISPFVDENDKERYIPERERELRGLDEEKVEKEVVEEEEDKFDIIVESKKKVARKVREQQ